MTTNDTDQDAQAAPAAPAGPDGPVSSHNGNHAGETVEVQGQEIPVRDENDPMIDPHDDPDRRAAAEDDEELTEPAEAIGYGVKVDARQEALVRQLGDLLPPPDAPADILQAFVDRILGRDRLGADVVLPTEPVQINREIECQIYAHRTSMLAGSPNPRTYLTLAFDGVRHAKLSGLLGANLKGTIHVNVIDLQAPLEDDDEAELPDAGVVRQAELPLRGRTPEDVLATREAEHREAYSVDNVGNVYRPHGFAPSPEDAGKCALCAMGEAHDLHAGKKRQAARTALRRRSEALLPHPYAATYSTGEGPASGDGCVYCSLGADDEIHVRGDLDTPEAIARPDEPLAFADRLGYWRDVEGIEETVAWARAEDDARDGICLASTDEDRLAFKLLHDEAEWSEAGELVGPLAPAGDLEASAAADLGRPLRDDELTDEMRDARRRLAGKSGD